MAPGGGQATVVLCLIAAEQAFDRHALGKRASVSSRSQLSPALHPHCVISAAL
jgi:hypothetical protein